MPWGFRPPVSYTHLDTVLGEGTYEVKEKYTGKELEYKEYEPLFDFAVETCKKQNKKAFYVT